MSLTLKWKRLNGHQLPMPSRANPNDAGLDLAVVVEQFYANHAPGYEGSHVMVSPGTTIVFRTGWAVEIPSGYYGQIVVRSSIGKAGWDIESSGVIDASYRGEIMMPMIYRGTGLVRVDHGQRMAQMVILPVPRVECIEVESLSDTPRGTGGFGSTGR